MALPGGDFDSGSAPAVRRLPEPQGSVLSRRREEMARRAWKPSRARASRRCSRPRAPRRRCEHWSRPTRCRGQAGYGRSRRRQRRRTSARPAPLSTEPSLLGARVRRTSNTGRPQLTGPQLLPRTLAPPAAQVRSWPPSGGLRRARPITSGSLPKLGWGYLRRRSDLYDRRPRRTPQTTLLRSGPRETSPRPACAERPPVEDEMA